MLQGKAQQPLRAINVELGKSHIEKSLETAFENFERVMICSDKKGLVDKLAQEIKPKEGKEVLFSLVWEVPRLLGIDAN